MKRLFLLGVILGVSWKISAQLPEFSYATPQFYKLGKMIQTLQPTDKGGLVTGGFQVSSIAGDGSKGTINAEGVLASFNQPSGVVVDKEGNIFVAD
ncbi:MAG: hypothetical protein Q8909_14400, partial [Bacteroidota bacterium]|nr:hypothetical protein [Bacteroidota bacterium]